MLERGAVLVTSPAWSASRMLTARVRLLPDSTWTLAHNQRVHLHHGTAEVLARVALLGSDEIGPGEEAWVQLRLEEPVAARARDRFVIRSYSPVATIGGGEIAEPDPPKRNVLDEATRARLERILAGGPAEALAAHVELQGWRGAGVAKLPVLVGHTPVALEGALEELMRAGALRAGPMVFAPAVRREGEARVLAAVAEGHAADPLRAGVSLAVVRAAFPRWASPELADTLVGTLVEDRQLALVEGGLSLPDHRPLPTPEQEAAIERLARILAEGGLGAPEVAELPEDLRTRSDIWSLLRCLEGKGAVVQVADGLYLDRPTVERAAARIRAELGGRSGLGPADFKEVLAVSRKRLLPLLHYFDGRGVTLRRGDDRDVPAEG
jgi:selenocysteine-specific elongation factor